MPYTAQKPAGKGKTFSLAFQEVIFVFSWGLLGGAVLLPVTDLWYAGALPALLVAVYSLASTETSGKSGPLVALELRQYSSAGKRNVSIWMTFFRIACTALLLPPLAVGFVTMIFGTRPLPELLTGTRITEIDRRLDPRPRRDIEHSMKSAGNRLRMLILAPLVASAAMFLLDYSAPEVISVQQAEPENELPEHERELLIQYLELTTLHPEELEYHVRLASLYYRNGMNRDLEDELDIIAGIDPEHAILLLADTTEFSFDLLQNTAGDSLAPDTTITLVTLSDAPPDTAETSDADTLGSDSVEIQPDTLQTVTVDIPEIAAADTTVETQPDTLLEEPAETPETETDEPDTLAAVPEEETIEPDTLVQP